jgi:hypothetical protein
MRKVNVKTLFSFLYRYGLTNFPFTQNISFQLQGTNVARVDAR